MGYKTNLDRDLPVPVTATTSLLIWNAEVISLQRSESSVQSSMAFSESISNVNLSFSTIRIIFVRLLERVVVGYIAVSACGLRLGI